MPQKLLQFVSVGRRRRRSGSRPTPSRFSEIYEEYAKLDAHTRNEAVTRARRLGLLAPSGLAG